MADKLLQVLSNKPGASTITLIDAEPSTTGWRLKAVDLGNAEYDLTYSGQRGTQGAALAGATAQNRLSTWTLEAVAATRDALLTLLSQLYVLDEELRMYGGTVTHRHQDGTFKMKMKVLSSGIQHLPFDFLWEHRQRLTVTFGVVTPPYMTGDTLDFTDTFTVDSESDYTFDAGSGADVAVQLGVLKCLSNPTVEKRMIHTARGYQYGDVQVTASFTSGSTLTNFKGGVIVRRIDASNYLEVYIDDNGTNSRLRIDKVVANVRTNLATTNMTNRIGASRPDWVRGRIEGANVFAEAWDQNTLDPSPMGAPANSVSYVLTAGEQSLFGPGLPPGVFGQVGIVWAPQTTSSATFSQVDNFDVQAFVYRNATLPDVFPLYGPSYGDARPLADIEITPSGGSAAPVWAAVGWWSRVDTYNRCWNGDFESALLGVNGWSVAAVTNINGAATSITRLSPVTSVFGASCGRLSCPATADTGTSFRIFGKFKKGVTYTAEAQIQGAAGATTNTYIRLGNGAANDKATSSNVALTGSFQRIVVFWTPTADYTDAHVAINIAAATATLMNIDGAMVYEGSVPPTATGQIEGRGGFPPLGIIETENGDPGPAANANYRSGFAADTTPIIIIDPGLLTPDDYAPDSIAIEVWGRVEYAGAPTALLTAQPISATAGLPVTYTEEFGNVGKVLVAPSSGTVRRLVRLGTLRLSTTTRYALVLTMTTGASDYLVMMPSNQRVLSPSGKVNDGSFPAFAAATGEITRLIRSDLSGRYREPGNPDWPAPGLGGSLIEMPIGYTDAVVKLSSLVPDDPTSDTTTEQLAHSATVHFSKTPRWRLGRGQ